MNNQSAKSKNQDTARPCPKCEGAALEKAPLQRQRAHLGDTAFAKAIQKKPSASGPSASADPLPDRMQRRVESVFDRSSSATAEPVQRQEAPPGFLGTKSASPSNRLPPPKESEPIQRTVGKDLIPGSPVAVKELKKIYYVVEHVDDFGYTVSPKADVEDGKILYTYEMLDYPVEIQALDKIENIPEVPKQYIRINSFAFAKSKMFPIASYGYMTCLGVIIHDSKQQLGGMAHIDTDAQVGIVDKTTLILNSVRAMIKSIQPENFGDLEISLFSGLGLLSSDSTFDNFLSIFLKALNSAGIASNQVNIVLDSKKSVKLAIYFPEQGKVFLDISGKSIAILEERSIKRLEYDGDDYEDQEEVYEKINGGNSIIIEVEFDEKGQETAHTEYAPNPLFNPEIIGSHPISTNRNPT